MRRPWLPTDVIVACHLFRYTQTALDMVACQVFPQECPCRWPVFRFGCGGAGAGEKGVVDSDGGVEDIRHLSSKEGELDRARWNGQVIDGRDFGAREPCYPSCCAARVS